MFSSRFESSSRSVHFGLGFGSDPGPIILFLISALFLVEMFCSRFRSWSKSDCFVLRFGPGPDLIVLFWVSAGPCPVFFLVFFFLIALKRMHFQ